MRFGRRGSASELVLQRHSMAFQSLVHSTRVILVHMITWFVPYQMPDAWVFLRWPPNPLLECTMCRGSLAWRSPPVPARARALPTYSANEAWAFARLRPADATNKQEQTASTASSATCATRHDISDKAALVPAETWETEVTFLLLLLLLLLLSSSSSGGWGKAQAHPHAEAHPQRAPRYSGCRTTKCRKSWSGL